MRPCMRANLRVGRGRAVGPGRDAVVPARLLLCTDLEVGSDPLRGYFGRARGRAVVVERGFAGFTGVGVSAQ